MRANAMNTPNRGLVSYLKRNGILYLLLIPGIVFVFIFCYIPMYGIIIAFQDYQPVNGFLGSEFVGLKWFKTMFSLPDFWQVFYNTFIIAVSKLIFGQIVAVLFALLLNEVRCKWYKKMVQTLTYLPHFLSWVIIGGVFINLLSMDGIVNQLLNMLGINSIFFLGSNKWFRTTLVVTDIWKGFGWNSILYLAALAGINQELYESAVVDGAGRWKQTLYVTLPGIMPTIVLLACLNLGGVLSAGFEQILVLYNAAVFQTGDVLDTYLYRMGLIDAQYSLSTAVGLIKSVLGFALTLISYKMAERFANYQIF